MVSSEHWDERYRSIGAGSVSWYEETPTMSLELLDRLGVSEADSVIDVGGGASTLVDHLLRRGHVDVTVLDLSAVALQAARNRLPDPDAVTWIEADLRTWNPTRRWDVWHDRAVLHFLTSDADRAAYVEVMHRALVPGGAIVVGTFAEDGPTECSSLPVRRQSIDQLVESFGCIDVVATRHHTHTTPSGTPQAFSWIAARLP